ncbi:hypothetical protein G6F68_012776 [Rhizopus microsporus]|nr:hypothetical protein G6F68_012776 [Rhizopus microsporus]
MLLTLASRHRPEAVPAGNPSAFMAGGAWGSSDPPVIAHQRRHAPARPALPARHPHANSCGRGSRWAALAGERCVTRPPRKPGEERTRDGGRAYGAGGAARGGPLPGGSGAGKALG